MTFKQATDRLAGCITHAEIARAARVSIQLIRQARLDQTNPSYRSPPPGWQTVLARLARERSAQLKALAAEIEKS